MRFEVLVATMHQKDKSLLKRMNISSDAVIINQCDSESLEEFEYNQHHIVWVDTTERGLSRSRNMALKFASAQICLLADDDEIFVDGYAETVLKAFSALPEAGLITYNIQSIDNVRKRYFNKKVKRLHFFNLMRYGSARIAFRRQAIVDNHISMDVRFGAGAEIPGGEDSIFLHQCLEKKVKAYAWPGLIAEIHDEISTWFFGYTEDFFYTRGEIFAVMSPRWVDLWILQYALRHYKRTKEIGFACAIRRMMQGKRDILKAPSNSQGHGE